MLTGETAEMIKAATGLNDEQVANFHPGTVKVLKHAPMLKYTIIAEVVKSEKCFAQVKVGDKLVFDPFLNPEKSVGVMCHKAVLPVTMQIDSLWEMLAEWAESGKDELPEIVYRNVRCMDPGVENGGIGGVIYRFRLEEMAP